MSVFLSVRVSSAQRRWDTVLNNLFQVETQREENKKRVEVQKKLVPSRSFLSSWFELWE